MNLQNGVKVSSIKRAIRTTVLLIFFVTCIIPTWFIIVSPRLDYVVCMSRLSIKLDENFFQTPLDDYLYIKLKPGMTRAEAVSELAKLGNFESEIGVFELDGEVLDTVLVKPCLHPMLYLDIGLIYSLDGQLIRYETGGSD
jgi:hypothetical protein